MPPLFTISEWNAEGKGGFSRREVIEGHIFRLAHSFATRLYVVLSRNNALLVIVGRKMDER